MQYKEVTSLFLATKLNIPYNVVQLPHPLIHQNYTSWPYPLFSNEFNGMLVRLVKKFFPSYQARYLI
jgi:hypothetical protein